MDTVVKVLDHGHVGLYDQRANDLAVVNSARISFDKRHDSIEDGDEKLISFLLRNRHGTPFEHTFFTFDIKAPIFVFREWHRHRIASINEMSARYTELPEEWYIPEPANVRTRIGKPGHYKYGALLNEPGGISFVADYLDSLRHQCQESYEYYKQSLKVGVAPEQARLFLHVNHYSHMFWSVNARSLMNFLSLRNEEHAQWEIRQFAIEVENIFQIYMPLTWHAFVDNGRIAP